MRSRPAVGGDLSLELGLSLREIARIKEAFNAFGAVRGDDTQLEAAFARFPRFVAKKFPLTFEPPEHGAYRTHRAAMALCNVVSNRSAGQGFFRIASTDRTRIARSYAWSSPVSTTSGVDVVP